MVPSPNADSPLSKVGVYGISMATDLDLIPQFPSRSGPPDLHVVAADTPRDLTGQDPLYSSPTRDTKSAPATRLYRVGDQFAFRFSGVAEFYVGPERIEYVLHDDFYKYGLELWLLGTVLAFWLEWRGVLALHASAASVNGQGVGFLASKQGGKSTLAMALLRQGCPLLTDDLLPVDVEGDTACGRPGYPQMRMWPEQARHFVNDADALRRAHPYIEKRRVPVGPKGIGAFCDDPRLLRALYIPERTEGASIEIKPVSATSALQAVLRHSFLPQLVETAGWQADRLGTLSQLVEHVPVRRLVYPSGIEHLPRIVNAILDAEA